METLGCRKSDPGGGREAGRQGGSQAGRQAGRQAGGREPGTTFQRRCETETRVCGSADGWAAWRGYPVRVGDEQIHAEVSLQAKGCAELWQPRGGAALVFLRDCFVGCRRSRGIVRTGGT